MLKSASRISGVMATIGISLALGGCGGDENGSSPKPIATGTPTSSPTPSPSGPGISEFQKFGALGQLSDTAFSSLSYGYRYRTFNDGWEYEFEPNSFNPDRTANIRFVAPDRLFLTIDGQAEGGLQASGGGSYSPDGIVNGASYYASGGAHLSAQFSFLVDGRYLKKTAQAVWFVEDQPGQMFPSTGISFSYGVPTVPSAVPVSGSAVYTLTVLGTIEANFATGMLGGTFGLDRTSQDLVFRLNNVAITPDRTGFAGEVIDLRSGSRGQIEGKWTGPGAEELMAKLVFESGFGYTIYLIQGGRMQD